MTGFILAAGFGTRLMPVTEHIPKALVTVCGESLLKRSLDLLRSGGIERIAVNSHHHPEQIEAFKKSSGFDFTIFHETGQIRGTGGALYFAREFLAGDDFFCVANVDIVTTIDLSSAFAAFKRLDCAAGLVAVPKKDYGTVWYEKDTKEYIGAPSEKERGVLDDQQRHATADFIGITFYKREFLNILLPQDFSIIPVWKRCREKGMSIRIIEAGKVYWKDAGSPATLASIHFDVLDNACSLRVPAALHVDMKKKIAHSVSLDDSSVARLGPYSWVEAASVPKNARLSRVVVFKDAVIPDAVSIEGSLVTKYGVVSFDS